MISRKHLFVLGLLAVLALSVTVVSTNAQSVQSMLTANSGEHDQHPMKGDKKHGHDDGTLDEDDHDEREHNREKHRKEVSNEDKRRNDRDEIRLGIRVHVNVEDAKLVLHVAGAKPNTEYTALIINGTSETVNLGNFTTNAEGHGVLKASLTPGDYNGSIEVAEKATGTIQFEIGNVKFTVPVHKQELDDEEELDEADDE